MKKSADMVFKFKQKFHPRALVQMYGSKFIVAVGLVDDTKSLDGGIELFDTEKGKSVYDKTENSRLCSLATLKTKKDIMEGSDMEFIFAGTSEKKII